MRHFKTYEGLEEDNLPDETNIEDMIEEVEKEQNLRQTTKHKNPRKSVEEYLEHKRLKKQYRDLFSDDFDLDDE